MHAEIISIGHELLMGEIVDTNASYLAQRLAEAGINLRWVSQVGDDLDDLIEAFNRARRRSNVTIASGGLGPTTDDLTREAVARAMGEDMSVNPDLLSWLKDVFARRGIAMPATNIKQAMLIPSARTIPNNIGTAPGWWVERDGTHIILVPGPPREIRLMWEQEIAPRLAALSGNGVVASRTLKTAGITEGRIDEMIAPLFGEENPYLGIYARADGIHLRLIARASSSDEAEGMLAPVERQIRQILGDAIWGVDGETPASAAANLLMARQLRVAAIEGASGGIAASMLSALPDSARFYRGALVTGSGPGMSRPGMSRITGEVSEDEAVRMAQGARQLFDSEIGLGVTPRAPDGGLIPAGTFFTGVATASGVRTASGRFAQATEVAMQRAATLALVELAAALAPGKPSSL